MSGCISMLASCWLCGHGTCDGTDCTHHRPGVDELRKDIQQQACIPRIIAYDGSAHPTSVGQIEHELKNVIRAWSEETTFHPRPAIASNPPLSVEEVRREDQMPYSRG